MMMLITMKNCIIWWWWWKWRWFLKCDDDYGNNDLDLISIIPMIMLTAIVIIMTMVSTWWWCWSWQRDDDNIMTMTMMILMSLKVHLWDFLASSGLVKSLLGAWKNALNILNFYFEFAEIFDFSCIPSILSVQYVQIRSAFSQYTNRFILQIHTAKFRLKNHLFCVFSVKVHIHSVYSQ